MKTLNFARNFMALRKKENLTQEAIAEKCGVSRQAVTKWESGSYPDISMIPVICGVFNINADELLFGDFYEKVNDYRITLSEVMSKLDTIQKLIKPQINDDVKTRSINEEYIILPGLIEQDDIYPEPYYFEGCKFAEKGELDEAIKMFEQALLRGNIDAATTLIRVYLDMLDIVATEGNAGDYIEFMQSFGKKMQVYGKIIVEEYEKNVITL